MRIDGKSLFCAPCTQWHHLDKYKESESRKNFPRLYSPLFLTTFSPRIIHLCLFVFWYQGDVDTLRWWCRSMLNFQRYIWIASWRVSFHTNLLELWIVRSDSASSSFESKRCKSLLFLVLQCMHLKHKKENWIILKKNFTRNSTPSLMVNKVLGNKDKIWYAQIYPFSYSAISQVQCNTWGSNPQRLKFSHNGLIFSRSK